MATWGDVETAVELNLGKTGDGNVATLMPIWADIFQKRVQRDRNYWFLKTVAERTIDQNSQTYPLPANFRDDMIFYIKQLVSAGDPANAFIELDAITDVDVIRTYEPVDTAGPSPARQKAQPEAYVVGANAMTFWPWPDKVYAIRCQYWKDIDPPIAASPSSYVNAWITNYPDLYIAELTAEGYRYLQEWDDARMWDARAKELLAQIRASYVARELASRVTFVPMKDVFGTTRQSQNSTWRVYN